MLKYNKKYSSMIKEYYNFIKEYLKLAELKPLYLSINVLTAFLYKGLSILFPIIASLIIKYLTIGDASKTYFSLLTF